MSLFNKHEVPREVWDPAAARLNIVSKITESTLYGLKAIIMSETPVTQQSVTPHYEAVPYGRSAVAAQTISETPLAPAQPTNAFPEAVAPAQKPVVPEVAPQYIAVQNETPATISAVPEVRSYAAPQNQIVPQSAQNYEAQQQAAEVDAARASIAQIHDEQLSGLGYEQLESERPQ